jgi:Holliday junction resolvasome RuvABC DNA-binding subunit
LEVLAKELQKVLGDRVYDKTPISKVQQQENEKSNIDFLGDALKSLGYNDNQVKLAQGLKFEQNLEPTEMITQSIRMLENQVNNQQQGQVHLMSSSTNRSR